MQIRGINPGKKGHGLEKTETSEQKTPRADHKLEGEGKAPVLLPTADRVSISAGLRERSKAIEELAEKAKAHGTDVDPKHQAKLASLKAKLDSGNLITPDVLHQTAQALLGDL